MPAQVHYNKQMVNDCFNEDGARQLMMRCYLEGHDRYSVRAEWDKHFAGSGVRCPSSDTLREMLRACDMCTADFIRDMVARSVGLQ
jgi:hypothetical protein